MASLLDALFGAGDPDLIAGVVGAWDLDFGCGFELQVLQFLSVFADDKAMVLFGDGNGGGGLRREKTQRNKPSCQRPPAGTPSAPALAWPTPSRPSGQPRGGRPVLGEEAPSPRPEQVPRDTRGPAAHLRPLRGLVGGVSSRPS